MATAAIQTRYRVEGMDCASCAAKINTAIRRVSGVEDISISVTTGTMIVSHTDESDLSVVEKKVRGLGYKVVRLPTKGPTTAPVDIWQCGYDPGHGDDHEHAKDDRARRHDQTYAHDHGDHKPGYAHGEEAVAGLHGHDNGPSSGPWWKSTKGLLTIASGLAVLAAYGVGKLMPGIEIWAFNIAMLVGLVPIARRASIAALNGTPFSIEMLMTIAAIGAAVIGAGEEGAVVVFLFLVGELLEGVAAGKARASIQSLTQLVPKTALLEEGGQAREVAADSLKIGVMILVRPGDRIPADGVIVEGDSEINEAPVTGESTPKRKRVEDNVFAGTVNGDAALRIRVAAAAADNTIARVVKLVEEAQESKAPTERFIDRFSRYYTPSVVVVAALVALAPPLLFGASWGEWIYKGLAILLIGCPCALVISTPAAIAAGLSAGARRGLLLKGGAVLETLRKITAAAFDKTGTLTEGKPKVTDILAFGRDEQDVLSLAAALETGSNHPLAVAILDRAKGEAVPVLSAAAASAVAGKGVTGKVGGLSLFLGSPRAAGERVALSTEQTDRVASLNGEGKTVSVLLADDQVAGIIALRDEPRADAVAGLKALAAAGIKTVMLTGDNRLTAEAIGRTLGIEPRGELLPQDKQRIVSELQEQGEVVAKVGDGINDAPALAAADMGIAMGGGTDVALETADAAVLHGRVMDVARMIELSKATIGNIRQNITIALGLKAVFLVTTILGITGLWPAILADTGATVLVTANAMRLLAWRGA